jgi:hypothetical protein
MVYLPGTRMYVPVIYCLMTSKHEAVYDAAFSLIKQCTGNTLKFLTIVTDFEKGEKNATEKAWFFPPPPPPLPPKVTIGCVFHKKQAVRRMMLSDKCCFPRELVHQLMGPGGDFEVVLVVPKDLVPRALAYVRSKIDTEKYHVAKVDAFFAYYEKTWLKYYRWEDWTLYFFAQKAMRGELTEEDLINVTNNALESFNRYFNDEFPSEKPQMDVFVAVIRRISTEKYRDMLRVQNGDLPLPVRALPRFPELPADWDTFVVPEPAPVVPVEPVRPLEPHPFAPFADPVDVPPPQPPAAAPAEGDDAVDGDAFDAEPVRVAPVQRRPAKQYTPRPSARRAAGNVDEGGPR